MPGFQFKSIDRMSRNDRSGTDYTHTISFDSLEDLNACRSILQLGEAESEPLELKLSKENLQTLSDQALKKSFLNLQTQFDNAIKNADQVNRDCKDYRNGTLLGAFGQLSYKADKAHRRGLVPQDLFILYKSLEHNHKLLLSIYGNVNDLSADPALFASRKSVSESKSTPKIEETLQQNVKTQFKALIDFNDKYKNSLPGRTPSRLGEVFSQIAMVIGVVSAIAGIVFAPAGAASPLALVGYWGNQRSKGAGYKKAEEKVTEAMDRIGFKKPGA